MQNLNSIERFLFHGNIYLVENSPKEDNIQNNININNNKSQTSNSKPEIEKDTNKLIPLRLLGSIINLYFYSKNPKRTYDQIKSLYLKNDEDKKKDRVLSHLSSIRSQTSIFGNESNLFDEEDISLDSQDVGNAHFIPRNLEDYILIKLPQNEIYMTDYDLNESFVE